MTFHDQALAMRMLLKIRASKGGRKPLTVHVPKTVNLFAIAFAAKTRHDALRLQARLQEHAD